MTSYREPKKPRCEAVELRPFSFLQMPTDLSVECLKFFALCELARLFCISHQFSKLCRQSCLCLPTAVLKPFARNSTFLQKNLSPRHLRELVVIAKPAPFYKMIQLGSFPSAMSKFTAIQTLKITFDYGDQNLRSSHIGEALAQAILPLSNLQDLWLCGNRGVQPRMDPMRYVATGRHITLPPTLKKLRLGDWKLTDRDFAAILNLPLLEVLSLSNSYTNMSMEDESRVLQNHQHPLKNLKVLDLDCTDFKEIVRLFPNVQQLFLQQFRYRGYELDRDFEQRLVYLRKLDLTKLVFMQEREYGGDLRTSLSDHSLFPNLQKSHVLDCGVYPPIHGVASRPNLDFFWGGVTWRRHAFRRMFEWRSWRS